jgi:hypothetical protein
MAPSAAAAALGGFLVAAFLTGPVVTAFLTGAFRGVAAVAGVLRGVTPDAVARAFVDLAGARFPRAAVLGLSFVTAVPSVTPVCACPSVPAAPALDTAPLRSAMGSPICKMGARLTAVHSRGWQGYGMYTRPTNMPLGKFADRPITECGPRQHIAHQIDAVTTVAGYLSGSTAAPPGEPASGDGHSEARRAGWPGAPRGMV